MAAVRDATEADMPQLVEWGRQFQAATQWRDSAPFDAASMEQFHRLLMKDHILLICKGGAAGAVVAPFAFNSSVLYALETFWWAGGGAGAELLRALEDRSRERGAIALMMVSLHGLRHETVGKLYERRGYRPSEYTYAKEL